MPARRMEFAPAALWGFGQGVDVTVAVRPQQVAALAQAQSTGSLSLSLVGADDETVAEAIEVDQNMLLGIEEVAAPAPIAQEEICTIKTRRGGEVISTPIPCTN